MRKKYVVRLTDAEREILNSLVKKQRVSAQKVLRARSCSRPMWMALLDRCRDRSRVRLSHANHRKHSGALRDRRL